MVLGAHVGYMAYMSAYSSYQLNMRSLWTPYKVIFELLDCFNVYLNALNHFLSSNENVNLHDVQF